jgi:hypothetical protein
MATFSTYAEVLEPDHPMMKNYARTKKRRPRVTGSERELTLARLTVVGHERETGLVTAEAMPAVLATVTAGAACAEARGSGRAA